MPTKGTERSARTPARYGDRVAQNDQPSPPEHAPIEVVSSARGERVLAVVVRDGVANLEHAVAVHGTARELIGVLESGGGLEQVREHLVASGAESASKADVDSRRFLESIRACDSPPDDRADVEIDADDAEQLARAVLAKGHRLRFQARGRSMRPFIPHGSTLEIEARTLEEIPRGAVVLYAHDPDRLVAHRVLARDARELRLRGDSCARVDAVDQDAVLGVVVSCTRPSGRAVPVSSGWRRILGLWLGAVYALAVGLARLLVVRPLRSTFPGPSWLRSGARGALRLICAVLLRVERGGRRLRDRLDVARAALSSSEEKDEQRRRLYERQSVQDFTALDENVEAGLTLLEERLVQRHGEPSGRALVLGCGPGRESVVLAARGFEVVGLDRESGMLGRARAFAERRGVQVELVQGEAQDFEVPGDPFDVVVVFSGLYNMLLPRARRVELLHSARRHLRPGGQVWITFLSAYVPPGQPPRPRARTLLEAINPEHEDGDRLLLNETVHVFPRTRDIVAEAEEAGLICQELHRDQRAYDRAEGRVRGYVVLQRP